MHHDFAFLVRDISVTIWLVGIAVVVKDQNCSFLCILRYILGRHWLRIGPNLVVVSLRDGQTQTSGSYQ